MGRKGQSRHLKRLNAPIPYRIERKKAKYTIRPRAQSSKISECIPITIVVREMLGYAKNLKESKRIIKKGEIFTDCVPRKDEKHSVGPMDVLSIPKMNKYYRTLPWEGKRQLRLDEIGEADSKWKLCKITGKTTLKKGAIQLNLHDGRTIKITSDDPNFSMYRVKGTIKISIPEQEILDYYPFEENVPVLVMRGSASRGVSGFLRSYEKRIGKNRSIAIVESGEKMIITSLDNIFVLGKDEAVIEI